MTPARDKARRARTAANLTAPMGHPDGWYTTWDGVRRLRTAIIAALAREYALGAKRAKRGRK